MSSRNLLFDLLRLEFTRLIDVLVPLPKGSRVAGELLFLTESVSAGSVEILSS